MMNEQQSPSNAIQVEVQGEASDCLGLFLNKFALMMQPERLELIKSNTFKVKKTPEENRIIISLGDSKLLTEMKFETLESKSTLISFDCPSRIKKLREKIISFFRVTCGLFGILPVLAVFHSNSIDIPLAGIITVVIGYPTLFLCYVFFSNRYVTAYEKCFEDLTQKILLFIETELKNC
ncbi:hypothetical protein HOF92_06710 [bacterium]|nr:hypothetical protein [bacterium]